MEEKYEKQLSDFKASDAKNAKELKDQQDMIAKLAQVAEALKSRVTEVEHQLAEVGTQHRNDIKELKAQLQQEREASGARLKALQVRLASFIQRAAHL